LNELRVAIVGCGKIADQHVQQIRRVAGSRLVATCDREKLMAMQLAERFQIERSFDDLDHLLNEVRPDVVHVTTPPQSHFELTKKCLEAGCHVYVEKPFSIDLREAQAMVALAEERSLKITAGHNVQFSPEMIRMRERVRSGVLGGSPVHVESVFSYSLEDASYIKSLLGDETHWVRALPGKLLQNVISHGIAKVAEFIDSSEISVSASGFTSPKLRSRGETSLIDELRVAISDNQKTTAYFTFSTQIAPPIQELRVFGPKGSIIVDNLHRTVVELKKSDSDYKSYLNFFVPPLKLARQYAGNFWANVVAFLKADFHMDAGMKNLIEAFYRSIQSGSAPPIPYREILLTAAIMDDIFCQLNSTTRTASTASAGVPAETVLFGERP
jgi:predicted dehydrogenase